MVVKSGRSRATNLPTMISPCLLRPTSAVGAPWRPFVTSWGLALYTAVKTCLILVALRGGEGLADAILQIWTDFDIATFGAIVNFWFLDRVLTHRPL